MIYLGDMVNAVADRIRPPSHRTKIWKRQRRKAVGLLVRAAGEGQLTPRWPGGSSPPSWYWNSLTAEKTVDLGVFCGPENDAWKPYLYAPMFVGRVEFDRWLATVRNGASDSKVSPSEANDEGGAVDRASKAEPVLHEASDHQVSDAVRVAYEEARRRGEKPPNLVEVQPLVQAILARDGRKAAGRRIERIAGGPEFTPLRWRPGQTKRSKRPTSVG
jgi:hypothetical protein